MPDPETGEWIGPNSLNDIVDPARRRARSAAAKGGTGTLSPGANALVSMLVELEAMAKEAKKKGQIPEPSPQSSPDLASFLRTRFGKNGPGGAAPGQQQGKHGGDKK